MSDSISASPIGASVSLTIPQRFLALIGACLAIFIFPLFPLGLEKVLTSDISSVNASSCLVTFSAAYAVISRVKVTSYICWAVALGAAGCFTPQLFDNALEIDGLLLAGFGLVIALGIFERFEMHIFSGKPMEF